VNQRHSATIFSKEVIHAWQMIILMMINIIINKVTFSAGISLSHLFLL